MIKKAFFYTVLLAITYGFIELTAYGAYRIKFGEYQIHDLQQAKLSAAQARQQSAVFVPENAEKNNVLRRPILHPYIGFTVDGKIIDPECTSSIPTECQTRIKALTDTPFAKRSSSRAIVGILGGSFADGTARGGSDRYFQKMMSQLPAFAGKEVVVYNMAAGAFKQPQQLMTLSYYLSLGAEFDIVINLDGFNELAGTFYGWRDAGLHPAFPKSWNHRVSSSISREHLRLYSQKFGLLESQSSMAEFAAGFPQRWSPLVNFMWRVMDPGYVSRVSRLDAEIDQLLKPDAEQRDFAYEALGPDIPGDNWDEVGSYTADIWLNSSIAMRDLSEGHGARYYHFLQPNQYIDGAKPMSAEERRIAILEHGGYGNVYKQSFHFLMERLEQLEQAGVRFYDLTHMFKDTPDTLYIDNCCHLNQKGYDMVSREIKKIIANDFYPLD